MFLANLVWVLDNVGDVGAITQRTFGGRSPQEIHGVMVSQVWCSKAKCKQGLKRWREHNDTQGVFGSCNFLCIGTLSCPPLREVVLWGFEFRFSDSSPWCGGSLHQHPDHHHDNHHFGRVLVFKTQQEQVYDYYIRSPTLSVMYWRKFLVHWTYFGGEIWESVGSRYSLKHKNCKWRLSK